MKTGITTSTTRCGMSLMEILVTISIVAILSVVAIPTYMSYFSSSHATIASARTETVNTAVHRFNECNYELNLAAGSDSAATVELSVIRTLQYRNPLNPKVGSPYVHARWNPVASSSTLDYRLQWKGTLFALLAPGTSGTGLKIDLKGGDMGTPYTFPANYTMVGN